MLKQIFFLFFPIYCFSQISGTVKDSKNQPLAGVDVLVSSTLVLAQTDSKGEFSLNLDIPKNTLIFFSKESYESKSVKYLSENEFNIILNKLHIEINEVEISAINHKLSSNQAIALQSLVFNSVNDHTLNIVDRLTHIPGVDQQSTGTGINKVTVRGLSGTRLVTYLNGSRIENQQWGTDHGIGFTELGIGKAELIKGPASLMFGADALAGVLYFVDDSYVNAGTSKLQFVSSLQTALMRFNNQIISKWAKNNFRMNTYAEYGSAADYRMPNGDFLFNSRFNNLALKTAMGYSTKNLIMNLRYQFNNNISGIPAHSHDAEPTIEQLTSSSQDRYVTRPTQFVNNHLLSLQNTFFINENTLKVDLAHSNNKLQEFDKWTRPEYDIELSSSQLNISLVKPFNESFKWTTGSQSAVQRNTNNPTTSQIIPDAKIIDFGLYSNIDYDVNDWSFLFGARYDYRGINTISLSYENEFNALSGALGFSKRLRDHNIKLSYSSAFRTPHFSELLSDGGHFATIRYELGDTTLKIEKGTQIDLTYEWADEHLGLIINPFFNNVDDFIVLSPTDSVVQGVPLYVYEQLNNVKLKGVEVNIHYHPHFLHQLHIEERISILEGQESDGQYLPLMPANTFQTSLKYYLVNENKLRCREFSLNHIYKLSQNKVANNESSSEDYSLINASILFGSKSNKINLLLGVRNLLNVNYIPHLSSLKRYEIPHVGRSYNLKLSLTL